MKVYIVIIVLMLSSLHLYAIVEDPNVIDKSCIVIKQKFEGSGNGNHEPILKKSTIYVNKDNKM